MLPPVSLPVINSHDILQTWTTERELAGRGEWAVKKQKMIMLEVKCELQVNDVTKEIADYGNRAVQKTAYATRRA